jgi:hypothetical protein
MSEAIQELLLYLSFVALMYGLTTLAYVRALCINGGVRGVDESSVLGSGKRNNAARRRLKVLHRRIYWGNTDCADAKSLYVVKEIRYSP